MPAVRPVSGGPPPAMTSAGGGPSGELVEVGHWLDEAPAWLGSAVLHFVVLILLALVAFNGVEKSAPPSLLASLGEEGEDLIEETLDLSQGAELELDGDELSPNDLAPVEDPLAAPTLSNLVLEPATTGSESLAAAAGGASLDMALSGRTAGSREGLLKAYGGTGATENAVVEGLKWLSRVQRNDGSWSLKGPYSSGAGYENRDAATAMALLAFQGAGRLPGDSKDPFSKVVERGWRWLLPRQLEDGSFFQEGPNNNRFYTNAQVTIALCELLAMTHDDRYRKPAQRAVDYLIESQTPEGGWKYDPGQRSDLSVTGWVLMALKSARMAGLEVPSPVFDKVGEYLDLVARDDPDAYAAVGSRYVYEESDLFNRESVPALTAEGLLCRQYLGWPRSDERLKQGVDFLLTFPIDWRQGRRNVYYWYYATQVLRHYGGDAWEEWNEKLRVELPARQQPRGRDRGSWDPRGDAPWGLIAGRLYETCLSIYILEVYYRHLPIYQDRAVR
ncbi:MAG: prenyltransferase/squalene oxidase repeat-containing protein [Lacipirellulaceae bacterium]